MNRDSSVQSTESRSFALTDLIDADDLQQLQDSFAAATGLASIIVDEGGQCITRPSNFCEVCRLVNESEKGRRKCSLSNDRRTRQTQRLHKPAHHQCLTCGFVDAGAPIIVQGHHIADWLIGQCDALQVGVDRIREYAREIEVDEDEIEAAYRKMDAISLQTFERHLELLWQFARRLSDLGYRNLLLKRELLERERLQAARRDSEDKYRSLFNNSNDGIIIHTVDGTIVDANSRALELFGCTRLELLTKRIRDLHPPEARDSCREAFDRILRDGVVTTEMDFVRNSGEKFPAEISSSMYTVGDRQVIQGIVRDVSERRHTEERLRRNEEDMRALLCAIPDMMFKIRKDGTFVASGDPDERMYASPDEFLGRKVEDVLPPDVACLMYQQMRLLYETGEMQVYEYPLMINGRECWFEARLVINCPESVIAIVRDRTAHKRQVEEEHRLKERLEKAERMESLGILAGGVAHDLNNMLGPLVGYPELILAKLPEDSPARKFVNSMQKAAVDASEVIQDLLTLARRGRYEMTPVDFHEVIEACLDSTACRNLWAKKPNIDVHVQMDCSVAAVQGSFAHLEKLVMNLVMNAFNAMSDTGTLTVTTERRQIEKLLSGYERIRPGEYVVLRVRDTGKGIDEHDIDRIFEPYYSRNAGSGGTGLGLAVVYGVVKDHRGYYDVLSEPGTGTEFIIYLPVTRSPVAAIEDQQDCGGGCETILVVDDSPEQRDLASAILSGLGYSVSTAPNGPAAIDWLQANRADLIVLDMIMDDDFDGLDTYREIVEIRPGQKAVIVSGFSSTERVCEMQRLGAGAYVRKPYTATSLGAAVRQALGRARETNAANSRPG